MILVDNKYYSRMITSARQGAHLSRLELARMLGITPTELGRYERGKEIIPQNILSKIFYHSFILLSARHKIIKPKKKDA